MFPIALIGLIAQGVGMMGQAQGGQADARLLRAQSRTAQQQSVADADAISRDARQLIGRQAAAMAQAGGSYTGSNAKILAQTEALATLDRLNTLYHGQLRGLGLSEEAKNTDSRTTMLAGSQLLSTLSSTYTRGKTIPTSY